MLTGDDLAALPPAELPDAVHRASVLARVSPEQELRLVEAFQSRGHVVAMTGDGINDAPALRQADIGVAMGRSGTEVAKEAADMVLTDDDFATIEAAVEEGVHEFAQQAGGHRLLRVRRRSVVPPASSTSMATSRLVWACPCWVAHLSVQRERRVVQYCSDS